MKAWPRQNVGSSQREGRRSDRCHAKNKNSGAKGGTEKNDFFTVWGCNQVIEDVRVEKKDGREKSGNRLHISEVWKGLKKKDCPGVKRTKICREAG